MNAVKRFEEKIWLSSPTMHGPELEYIKEAYETNWMSTVGKNINEVERLVCEKVGCKYAVALSAGTASLHMAVKLAGVKPGDRVFCSDMTFDATVNPIVYEGGIPIFIDTEYDTWNMDPVALEKAFEEHTAWYSKLPAPYFVNASQELFDHFKDSVREGITIAAPGFYAPQGRHVRLEPHDLKLNEKIEAFEFEGRRITNFEMEGSALAGLAALMGHRAATICTIIAQRVAKDACTDYKPFVRKMIEMALNKLAEL